jgi:uroporphyrinogen-III synthase
MLAHGPTDAATRVTNRGGPRCVEPRCAAQAYQRSLVLLEDTLLPRALNLNGRRIGLQLYGTQPNRPLVDFLDGAGAQVLIVASYAYADAADDQAVLSLIHGLQAGKIDAIAFTSTPQVDRLFSIAPAEVVLKALTNTVVAAVGPVVGDALRRHGIEPRVTPEESFFLKPLTTELEDALCK